MATPVMMPRQGQSVESCIITEWKKKVGDAVQVGDILFSYETDKSTFEEAAKADGTLLAVFFNADDDVPVLTNVAVIGNPGESFTEFAPGGAAPAKAEQAAAPAVAEETKPVAQATAARAEGVSPRARATADQLGVDPATAQPTGPQGRVIERDVIALSQNSRTGSGLGGRQTASDAASIGLIEAPAAKAP